MVSVRVHMHEVRRLEQGDVGEDLGRRPRRDDPMLLGEHDAPVGELVESSEVVRRADDRLPGPMQLDHEVEKPVLRARVERRGRLVEQQNVRVRHEHGGDRDALLLAAGELIRRPLGELGDVEEREHVVDAPFDLGAFEPEVERSERHFVAHGRREELGVGALEHEADTRSERARELVVVEDGLVSSVPKAWTVPRSGTMRPASNLSIVDFPHPFAPSRATRSPARTVSETPASATNRSR